MERRLHRGVRSSKRRTTLTLPSDSLGEAERIARSRNVTLSTVIAEALTDGLQLRAAAKRGEQVLRAYEQAFAGFSEEELMVLDGIALEPLPAK
jgi:hypothetical protein